MTRHLADKRSAPGAGRIRNFLRIERAERPLWHRTHARAGTRRLLEFLRIARGRTT